MVSISQGSNRTFSYGKALQGVALLTAVVGFAILAVVASEQAYTELDLRIARWVQGLHIPGLEMASTLASFVTNAYMAFALWIVAMTLLTLKGRPVEAIAIFLISALWVSNQFIGAIIDRPSPSPEILGVVEFSRETSGSFPSGHVAGAVAFYGLLTFLTFSNVRSGSLRWIVPALAVTIVGLSSISRIYVGAHWPSDVLGSYVLSLIGIAGIAWVYINIKNDTLRIPRPRRKQSAPAIDGVKVASSIASKVYLDPRAGTATKEYFPPLPVRALYWLAYQAPFPYQRRRDALEAAAAKRKIAGLLTRHEFGYDMVAAAYRIEDREEGYGFVTEYIAGVEPESNAEVRDFLARVYDFFQEAGLPTWKIAPGNPHAYSNFIRKPDGTLKLIDLESALISSTSSFKQLRSAMRDGVFPVFDDVDFHQLRNYVSANTSGLEETLGSIGYAELRLAIGSAEASTRTWRDSEPRIWGRAAAWVHRRLDFSGPINTIRGRMGGAEAMAIAFLNEAVDRWEREGRIDSERAASLQATIATSEMKQLVGHLGAHLVLSVAIVVPIPGLRSAARFGWTAAFRIKALYDLARGNITREEYRVARSIHSIPVMLIALIPGFGAISYVARDTMVKTGLGRMLLDQTAHKLPFGLYRRLRLERVTMPRSRIFPSDASGLDVSAVSEDGSVGRRQRSLVPIAPQPAHASLGAGAGLDVYHDPIGVGQLAALITAAQRSTQPSLSANRSDDFP